ncbi:MAG: HDOD domain-containing protein [Nitrosomonadales bacterium]|nr:HDOD domain-containing protein [Nitrosomonadales bacterium]
MKLVDPASYAKLKETGQLPSLDGLALAIVKLLQRDDYKNEELVRLIESDPVIAGEILKFSNAAPFGNVSPIVSLAKAVTTLGTRQIGMIVAAFSLLNKNRIGRCTQFDYDKFWARSLATAIAAHSLAGYVRTNPDENFTAGLLSGIGELALASVFPERYGEIIDMSEHRSYRRIALERESFSNDHRELSATLMLEWGLPLKLVAAVYHCEAPDEAEFQDRNNGLILSLHVALTLADICVAEDDERSVMLPNLYAKAGKLGVDREEMALLAERIIATWKGWCEQLKIKTSEAISVELPD